MIEQNSLEDNYIRFKECLRKRQFPKYDEFDLVEIFDIAGDNNDLYVQSEVLMLGARLFPMSKELLQRRGYFYANINPDGLSEFIDNNPQFDGVCWDLLRLRESGVEGPDAELMFNRILSKYKRFDDEDVIRLVELVRELKCEDWFINNCEILEKKAEYSDTVLFEVAVMEHDRGNEEKAITALERLTKIDPFRAENWILMAESYLNIGKFEDAMKAIEFARAVENNIPETDAVEGGILIGLKKDLPRAISLLEGYNSIKPGNKSVINNLALAYKLVGDKEKSIRFLRALYVLEPDNVELLKELVAQSPSIIKDLIEMHLNESDEDPEIIWVVQAAVKELVFSGDFKSAIALGRAVPNLATKLGIVEYYLWAMMLDNDWKGIIEFYDTNKTGHEFLANDPETLFYVAYACLNSGLLERAKDLSVDGIEKSSKLHNYHLSFGMTLYGCQQAFSTIVKLVDYGNQEMINIFDPLRVKEKD